jgi:hypothetical protein
MSRDTIKTVTATTGTDQDHQSVTGTQLGVKRLLDVAIKEGVVLGVTGPAVTATFYNIALGATDTEQSQALPATIAGYLIRSRGRSTLKLSHVATESGTKYVTVRGSTTHVDEHKYSGLTLYFQSPQTSDTVEIIAWGI